MLHGMSCACAGPAWSDRADRRETLSAEPQTYVVGGRLGEVGAVQGHGKGTFISCFVFWSVLYVVVFEERKNLREFVFIRWILITVLCSWLRSLQRKIWELCAVLSRFLRWIWSSARWENPGCAEADVAGDSSRWYLSHYHDLVD